MPIRASGVSQSTARGPAPKPAEPDFWDQALPILTTAAGTALLAYLLTPGGAAAIGGTEAGSAILAPSLWGGAAPSVASQAAGQAVAGAGGSMAGAATQRAVASQDKFDVGSAPGGISTPALQTKQMAYSQSGAPRRGAQQQPAQQAGEASSIAPQFLAAFTRGFGA